MRNRNGLPLGRSNQRCMCHQNGEQFQTAEVAKSHRFRPPPTHLMAWPLAGAIRFTDFHDLGGFLLLGITTAHPVTGETKRAFFRRIRPRIIVHQRTGSRLRICGLASCADGGCEASRGIFSTEFGPVCALSNYRKKTMRFLLRSRASMREHEGRRGNRFVPPPCRVPCRLRLPCCYDGQP